MMSIVLLPDWSSACICSKNSALEAGIWRHLTWISPLFCLLKRSSSVCSPPASSGMNPRTISTAPPELSSPPPQPATRPPPSTAAPASPPIFRKPRRLTPLARRIVPSTTRSPPAPPPGGASVRGSRRSLETVRRPSTHATTPTPLSPLAVGYTPAGPRLLKEDYGLPVVAHAVLGPALGDEPPELHVAGAGFALHHPVQRVADAEDALAHPEAGNAGGQDGARAHDLDELLGGERTVADQGLPLQEPHGPFGLHPPDHRHLRVAGLQSPHGLGPGQRTGPPRPDGELPAPGRLDLGDGLAFGLFAWRFGDNEPVRFVGAEGAHAADDVAPSLGPLRRLDDLHEGEAGAELVHGADAVGAVEDEEAVPVGRGDDGVALLGLRGYAFLEAGEAGLVVGLVQEQAPCFDEAEVFEGGDHARGPGGLRGPARRRPRGGPR